MHPLGVVVNLSGFDVDAKLNKWNGVLFLKTSQKSKKKPESFTQLIGSAGRENSGWRSVAVPTQLRYTGVLWLSFLDLRMYLMRARNAIVAVAVCARDCLLVSIMAILPHRRQSGKSDRKVGKVGSLPQLPTLEGWRARGGLVLPFCTVQYSMRGR